MKPLISIIIPVYNNEKYFPIAVESVLGQIYKNIELIIVDDGSTDRTPEIADEIAEKDSRVKVIHQENQWIYASFNNGIAEANGEYIYILNSDDKLYDNALGIMADLVGKYNPDVIWTKVIINRCDEEQTIIQKDLYGYGELIKKQEVYLTQNEVKENWVGFYDKRLSFNQANLYRTSIAKKHKFRNDVYMADHFFNLSIADDIKSAVVCEENIYCHLIYDKEGMNASVGKFYGYEHEMFNKLHIDYVNLLKEWKVYTDEALEVLSAIRLNNFTNELNSLMAKNCNLTIDEKIDKIFGEYLDDVVMECAEDTGREEELESRMLSFCRTLFLKNVPDKESKYYFIYELLENLLRYEKTDEDMNCIKKAVYHENNLYKFGERFYKKMIGE